MTMIRDHFERNVGMVRDSGKGSFAKKVLLYGLHIVCAVAFGMKKRA